MEVAGEEHGCTGSTSERATWTAMGLGSITLAGYLLGSEKAEVIVA
jgi:hypothetical protein